MSGNLHKSDAGWRRINALTSSPRSRKGGVVVRSAHMNHSADPAVPQYRRSRKSVATTDAASSVAHQPHLRNRRRIVIDTR